VSGHPAGQDHQAPGHGLKDGLGQDCAQQVGDGEVQDDLLQPGFRLVPPGHGVGDPGQDRVHHHHVYNYGGVAHNCGHHDGRAAKLGEEGAGVKARQDVGGPEAVAEKVPEEEGAGDGHLPAEQLLQVGHGGHPDLQDAAAWLQQGKQEQGNYFEDGAGTAEGVDGVAKRGNKAGYGQHAQQRAGGGAEDDEAQLQVQVRQRLLVDGNCGDVGPRGQQQRLVVGALDDHRRQVDHGKEGDGGGQAPGPHAGKAGGAGEAVDEVDEGGE